MNVHNNLSTLLMWLVLFAAPYLTGQARAQSIESLLDRLERKYESMEALEAEFTQTVTLPFDEESSTQSGTLLLAGEKYRYETDTQISATDGETTWNYAKEENTFMISDVIEGEGSFAPGEFFANFDDTFDTRLAGTENIDGKRHYVIRLSPKAPDAYFTEATVWMDQNDDLITQMELKNIDDTVVFFKMENIVLNPSLEEDAFELEPPEGATVVDLRNP